MAETTLKVAQQTQICRSCGRELPVEMFRMSKLGRHRTCKECTRQHQIQAKLDKKLSNMKQLEVSEARTLRLKDFTPRELMAELKRRGYKYTMEYTETHIINSKDIEI